MGKYLKLFETHSAYSTYINGQDKILPNVSYCEDNNEVHYNPWTDPRLITKFNVEDDSETTMIYGGMKEGVSVLNNFTKIEVDGVEISLTDLNENNGYYQLSEGEHTIRYTLADPLEIGRFPFYGCYGLTNITIPDSVTSIGGGAFSNCTGLTNITIPNSVTSIVNNTFSGCSGLTSVTIPDSVTSIGDNVFMNCGLTSITIHNSVTSIGGSAFYNCTSLTNVTIGSGVTSIGNNAFAGCSNLFTVTSYIMNAPIVNYGTFSGAKNGGTLYVPIGSSGYETWMAVQGNLYSWTKVEQ